MCVGGQLTNMQPIRTRKLDNFVEDGDDDDDDVDDDGDDDDSKDDDDDIDDHDPDADNCHGRTGAGDVQQYLPKTTGILYLYFL